MNNSAKIKHRYDRIAPYFDCVEGFIEGLFFKRWRQLLWNKINGKHILEIGVGTGKNFPFYPKNCEITAIDFSDKMLAVAHKKRETQKLNVTLTLMDVESLCYAENSFDNLIASFVFCSVPHPRKGLKELHRVCKVGGQVILLEHVLSTHPMMAKMMNCLNPITVRLFGANINRETIKSVQACGFNQVRVEHLSSMVKLIIATK